MKQKNLNKVFGIGFNKTGTTTLGRCFEALGFTPVAEPRVKTMNFLQLSHEIFKNGNYAPALYTALEYRSFQDRPWNIWNMYKILDAAFPESKFILTYRDPENWRKSVDNWLSITNKNDSAKLERYLDHLRVDCFN